MTEHIDPGIFGISGRPLIEKTGPASYTIVINRKSRIIMSDGKKISAMAEKIRATVREAEISLKSSAPVCGKTRKYLTELGIEIQ